VIAVVDYGMGNLRSVERALAALGADARITREHADLRSADAIVLPGVGAFGIAMDRLRQYGLDAVLTERVCNDGVPFLGICLGMQLICRQSYEHGHHLGLGWIEATVRKLEPGPERLRIPHIGWNDVTAQPGSTLLPDRGTFYFVHSYHVDCEDDGLVSAVCNYGATVAACLERDNIMATQFHPEKSQDHGLDLLRRFLVWQPSPKATV
jgi:glutamine amidotransferase